MSRASQGFGRLRQLARTSAIRLALHYALWQVAVLAIALGGLYFLTQRYVATQIEASLHGEIAELSAMPESTLRARIAAFTDSKTHPDIARHYLMQPVHGAPEGDIRAWPESVRADGMVRTVHLVLRQAEDAHDREESVALPAVATRLREGGGLLIAQDTGRAEDLREFALAAAGGVLLLTAALSLALGWVLGWRWLKRIEAINQTAGAIAAGDLGQRVVTTARGDEFDLLAAHLNHMLARIEHAVAGMRDVSDNVAHDLRKPLARLKTRLEVTLLEARGASEYRAVLAQTVDDVDDLMRTFEALLSIARLEAGSEIAPFERIDLAVLAGEVAELYAAQAEDEARRFELDIPVAPMVDGNRQLLAQALSNLFDNAFKYSPSASPVTLALTARNGRAIIEVADHGPGIAAGEHARMTERFTRGDAARSLPGSGLGLALVKAIAGLHGGRLELADIPGGGLIARIVLPLSPTQPYREQT